MALMNYFTKKDLFTEAEFSQGIDSMTNLYFDSGYLDFQILNVDTTLDDSKENMSIRSRYLKAFNINLEKLALMAILVNFSK